MGEEGAVWVEQVPPLAGHRGTEQHVHAAEEEVVGVDEIIVDLRVLPYWEVTTNMCRHGSGL